MRHWSLLLHVLALVTLPFPLRPLFAQNVPECHDVAFRPYPKNRCYVVIAREKPENPTAKLVPSGTTVEVRVTSPRPQELITVTTQTDQVAAPDVGAAFLKQVLDPLKSFLGSEKKQGPFSTVSPPGTEEEKQYIQDQEDARTLLARDVLLINKATVALSCLQTYTAFVIHPAEGTTPETYSCDQANVAIFAADKTKTIEYIDDAAKLPIPIGQVDAIKTAIADSVSKGCYSIPNKTDEDRKKRTECLLGLNQLQSNQLRLTDTLTGVENARKALLQGEDILLSLAPVPNPFTYSVQRTSNRKATIKVRATEQIGKSNTDLSTIVVTWQNSSWVLSTGFLVSSLADQSFSNSIIYVNGIPSPDGTTGKYLTQVALDSTQPTIVLPIVLESWRIPWSLGRNGNRSLLISGGAGANLTSKTTDFAAGISLQLRSVLLSPVAHFARQTELSDGVYVGEKLGSSPPALPLTHSWKPSFGFAITYSLPIP